MDRVGGEDAEQRQDSRLRTDGGHDADQPDPPVDVSESTAVSASADEDSEAFHDDQSERDADRLRALHRAATSLSEATTDEAVYDAAVTAADQLLGFDLCEVFERNGDALELVATSDPDGIDDVSFGLDDGVLGTTYQTGETIVVDDALQNPDAAPTDESNRSAVSVPIVDRGVLQAIAQEPDAYDQTDAELAEVLVAHVESALNRLETEQRLRRQTQRTQKLHAVASELETCHTHEALFDLVIDAAAEVLGFEWCAVLTVDDGRFVAAAASDGTPADVGDRLLPTDRGMVGHVYQTGESRITGDVHADELSEPVADSFTSSLAVPIGDVGVFNAVSAAPDAFSDDDVELAELLAGNVTEAYERIEVQKRLRERQEELNLLKQIQSRVLRHNIRNELSTIRMAAEQLREEAETTDVDELSSLIVQRTDELVTTSEKARQMEQVIERRKQVVTDLAAVVESAVDGYADRYPEATIETDIDALSVRAHPDLPTAVDNLIENAIVHTGSDTTVWVTVERDESDAVCRISDDGPGIPSHETAVLERNEETDLEHGSGAGLWLVRWIVDYSDGKLSFDRQDGKTVVEFRVPLAD